MPDVNTLATFISAKRDLTVLREAAKETRQVQEEEAAQAIQTFSTYLMALKDPEEEFLLGANSELKFTKKGKLEVKRDKPYLSGWGTVSKFTLVPFVGALVLCLLTGESLGWTIVAAIAGFLTWFFGLSFDCLPFRLVDVGPQTPGTERWVAWQEGDEKMTAVNAANLLWQQVADKFDQVCAEEKKLKKSLKPSPAQPFHNALQRLERVALGATGAKIV